LTEKQEPIFGDVHLSSKAYNVKNSLKVLDALLQEDNPDAKLKLAVRNPIPSGYKPE
jgi:hypothetical protein